MAHMFTLDDILREIGLPLNLPPAGQQDTVREKALAVLDAILKAQPELDAINEMGRRLFGDVYPHQSLMPDKILEAVIALIDVPLEGNASYILYDAPKGGGNVEIDGKKWPLRGVDDLRTFLAERPPAMPRGGNMVTFTCECVIGAQRIDPGRYLMIKVDGPAPDPEF